MGAQSVSISVPSPGKCINQCKFCVSCMHPSPYENRISTSSAKFSEYVKEYVEKLNLVRKDGCKVAMITGRIEPQQNIKFLERLSLMFHSNFF